MPNARAPQASFTPALHLGPQHRSLPCAPVFGCLSLFPKLREHIRQVKPDEFAPKSNRRDFPIREHPSTVLTDTINTFANAARVKRPFSIISGSGLIILSTSFVSLSVPSSPPNTAGNRPHHSRPEWLRVEGREEDGPHPPAPAPIGWERGDRIAGGGLPRVALVPH